MTDVKFGAGPFLAVLLLAFFFLLISPFVTIWALNTLFALGIEYNIWTWLASAWIGVTMFGGKIATIRKKD